MTLYFKDQFIDYFNRFVDQIGKYFTDDSVKVILDNNRSKSRDEKLECVTVLTNSMSNNTFETFITSKIKTFSHKNDDTKKLSESLFGSSLTLKQLLNNQPDEIKKTIWIYLHVLYLYAQLSLEESKRNQDHINRLYKELNVEPHTEDFDKDKASDRIYTLLNVQVNNETKSMIDEIIGSFDPLLSGKEENPISSIMQISQNISTKYADKINTGEIELDKLMDSIKSKVPGMNDILANFNQMKPETEKENERVIIDENYSTSKVPTGEQKESTSNFNIGKILKSVDSLGVLPKSDKDKDSQTPGLSDMFSMFKNMQIDKNGAPSMDSMMKVMDNPEFKNMMNKMDINKMMEVSNMSALNKQLDTVLNK